MARRFAEAEAPDNPFSPGDSSESPCPQICAKGPASKSPEGTAIASMFGASNPVVSIVDIHEPAERAVWKGPQIC